MSNDVMRDENGESSSEWDQMGDSVTSTRKFDITRYVYHFDENMFSCRVCVPNFYETDSAVLNAML